MSSSAGTHKSKFRVMLVVSTLAYGGAEQQVVLTANGLSSRGHKVLVCVLSEPVPRLSQFCAEVEVHVGKTRSLHDLKSILSMRLVVKSWKPDIVHSFLFAADIFARIACMGTKIQIVNSERSYGTTLRCYEFLIDIITSWRCNAVVANNFRCIPKIRKRYRHLADSDFHVVNNCIDIDLFAPNPAHHANIREVYFKNPDCRLAIMVASIRPLKDYILAIQVAFEVLKLDPTWRFLFVGDVLFKQRDGYKATVTAEVERLCLVDTVCFAGIRSDLHSLLSEADIAFLTSHNEGFPNVILEAMAAHVPVVSTDVSDLKSVLPQTWQVVSDRNPVTFAKAIIAADKMRSSVVSAQLAWLNSNCQIEIVMERLESVYSKYVGKVRP